MIFFALDGIVILSHLTDVFGAVLVANHDKSVKRIPSKLSKPRVLLSCAVYGAENLYENFLQSELSKEVEFVGCHCDPYLLPRSSFSENYLVPYAKDTVKYIEAIKSIINKENIELFVPKSCKEIW